MQATVFGDVDVIEHVMFDKPRREDGRFLPVLPKCKACGQPIKDHSEHAKIEVRFNGSDYDPEKDDMRLKGQILLIFNLMEGGDWFTLADLEFHTHYPPASISAQMRHLRKPRFGAHTIEKKNLGNGLFAYRLIVNPKTKDKLIRVLK